tara:strand:+ start:287 stop:463 length:177 start_codon:yes stop_codon:yes gene_type:complete
MHKGDTSLLTQQLSSLLPQPFVNAGFEPRIRHLASVCVQPDVGLNVIGGDEPWFVVIE